MLELKNISKKIILGTNESKQLLQPINFTINEGDFITVLGGNGAGKSTLFNILSGTLPVSSGKIMLAGKNITNWSDVKRAQLISRVFQDPKIGTAPRMTVAENLLLAQKRGKPRLLKPRHLGEALINFTGICQEVGNGLDKHLNTPTGQLSGGQRQALSLLMATITAPKLLLLDEHTAALDPKTAKQLMRLTNKRVQEQSLTCLMITHQMEDALAYGNRLIVLNQGQITHDFDAAEKAKLKIEDLLRFFETIPANN